MVASQSKVLTADEVFELPPYADNLLITVSATPTVVCRASSGGTDRAVAITEITADQFYSIAGPILPFFKCNVACTLHYRVSKR